MTALHLSAWQRNLNLTKLLLDYDADVNALDADKESPLYSAVAGNDDLNPIYKRRALLPIVELLLEHGARPDQFSILYVTPSRLTKNDSVKKILAHAEKEWHKNNPSAPPVDNGWKIKYNRVILASIAKKNQKAGLHRPLFKESVCKIDNDEDDADLQFSIALKYSTGKGCRQSDENAALWYKKAASQGHAEAAFNLGVMCHQGRLSKSDNKKPFDWFLQSAELGFSDAQYNVGNMYRDGDGVPVSHEKAVYWLKQASDQGNPEASLNLAHMYMNEKGGNENGEEAYRILRELAFSGSADAMNSLGVMLANGRGVEKDLVVAYHWFFLSYESGFDAAAGAIEKLRTMIPIDLANSIEEKIPLILRKIKDGSLADEK